MIKLNYPKTIGEAVDILEHILLDIEKEGIMNMPEQGVVDLYLVYGKWIKNNLGLCDGNYELISDCNANEPEEASIVIIQALWKTLNSHNNNEN